MLTKISYVLWRLYYIVITFLVLSGIMHSLSGLPNLYQFQFITVQILALIALHGYITRRAYFTHTLWKIMLIWYLGAMAYELYLFLTSQLIPHSMLKELLLITTGVNIQFGSHTRAILSVMRDGLVLPLLVAMIGYARMFKKIAAARQQNTSL